jgi:DNA polymerase-3 subunit gamma/tau
MRDAESMLDQILAAGAGRIEESSVRELLGLADTEVVDRLIEALVDGDAPAGMTVLAELDDRGRDAGVVLEQLVEQIRTELAASLAPDGDRRRGAALAALARRLAAIDPERRGVGGTRFQLELALLDAGTRDDAVSAATRRERPSPVPEGKAPPQEAVEPTGPKPSTSVAAAPPEAEPAPISKPATPDASTSKPMPAPKAAPEPAAALPPQPATSPATAPADQPQPPAPAPAAASGTSAGVDELRARWPEVVAFLSLNPPVKPLIEACRPISVEGHLVTLGFPEDKAFLKIALERRGPLLEEGIGRILGRTVNVRCVATNLEHVPAVSIEAENADLISEARRIFADDLVDVGEVS